MWSTEREPLSGELASLRRLELNLSLAELARRAGVSETAVRRVEAGYTSTLSVSTAALISAALGMSLGEWAAISERHQDLSLDEQPCPDAPALLGILYAWGRMMRSTAIMEHLVWDRKRLAAAKKGARRRLAGTGLTLYEHAAKLAIVPTGDVPHFWAMRLIERKHAARERTTLPSAKFIFAVWQRGGSAEPFSRLQTGAALLRAGLLIKGEGTLTKMALAPEVAFTLDRLRGIVEAHPGSRELTTSTGQASPELRYSVS